VAASIKKITDTTRHKREMVVVLDDTGAVLTEVVGEKDSVDLSDKRDRLSGARMLIHNHPKGTSFSLADLLLAVGHEIKEMLVTGNGPYDYKLKISKKQGLQKIEDLHKKYDEETLNIFWSKIEKGEMTHRQAILEHAHRVMKYLAKDLGWEYGRIRKD